MALGKDDARRLKSCLKEMFNASAYSFGIGAADSKQGYCVSVGTEIALPAGAEKVMKELAEKKFGRSLADEDIRITVTGKNRAHGK